MKVDFHFGSSRGDLRPALLKALTDCKSLKIITGFVTKSGIKELGEELGRKLDLLVFGHSNPSALEAMVNLFNVLSSLGKSRIIKVHLGYGHKTKEENNLRFLYRPMMHSKIFLFENPDGTFKAFVGSQNITGYSLMGLNSEAAVVIEGDITEPIYGKLVSAILSVDSESQFFRPEKLETYSKWARILTKGMESDEPRVEGEKVAVLYALVDQSRNIMPKIGDTIYFEVSREDGEHFSSINGKTDIWLFPFDSSGKSLANPRQEPFCFRASQGTINDARLKATNDLWSVWYIPDFSQRMISYLNGTPTYGGGEFQVRLKLEYTIKKTYSNNKHGIVTYAPLTKKSTKLIPLLEENGPYYENMESKLERGEEHPFEDEWALIKGFKELESEGGANKLINNTFPQPADIIENKEILRSGVFFNPKARAIVYNPND